MSIRILHTSDLHLGAKLLFLGQKAEEYRAQIKTTFTKVVDLAIQEKVHVMLIAGDVFDSTQPHLATVQFFVDQIYRLTQVGIHVAVIPGNHDFFSEGGTYQNEAFTKLDHHFHLFTTNEIVATEIPELDLTIYARGTITNKESQSILKGLQKSTNSKYHVGLFHGSVPIQNQTNAPVVLEEIAKSGMDYVALGDWHGAKNVTTGKVTAWYPGSLEPLASDQQLAGSVLLVDLHNEQTSVKQVRVGSYQAVNKKIDITGFSSLQQLRDQILHEMGDKTLVTVELVGVKDLQFPADELPKTLESLYWFRVIDNAQIKFDEKTLQSFPAETITGQFIRSLYDLKQQGKISPELVDDALQYGVRLLTGKS